MKDFDLKKYLAEGKLLKENMDQLVNPLETAINDVVDDAFKVARSSEDLEENIQAISGVIGTLIRNAIVRNSENSELTEDMDYQDQLDKAGAEGSTEFMPMSYKLKIGEKYDVKDAGDGEFREDMEYLGYSRNENAHMFRGFGSPGSNDIDLMYVEKGDEEGMIK